MQDQLQSYVPQPGLPDTHWGIMQYGMFLIGSFLFLLLLSILVRPKTAMKHWYHHFADLNMTPKEIYAQIEAEVKKRNMPNVKYGYKKFFQSGIFSARREYLSIDYEEFTLDVCCAKFGTGYYISWWLGIDDPGFLARIPIINNLLGINPKYQSYYQIDVAEMFQSGVHEAILSIIDGITTQRGLRMLSELERQPMMGK